MIYTGRLELSPKLDVVFKKLFTENEAEFRVFLSDMLGIPLTSIQELEYLNTERPPETVSEKLSRLDICLHVADRAIDVEIQVKNNRNYQQRSLFYWGRLYVSGLKKGERYISLRPAITLNLLDYTMFENREAYHATVVPEFKDTHEIFSNHLEMHFIELSKVKFGLENWKEADKIERKRLWLLFLNAKTWEELEMLKSTNHAEIQNIIEAYRMLCADDAFKCGAINRDMEIHDYVSDMADSLEEGIAIGEERGIAIGEERGEARGVAKLVQSLAQSSGNDPGAICASLGMDAAQIAKVLAILPTLQATAP